MVYKHIYIYIDQLITLILYYPYIKHIRNNTFKQSSFIDKARKNSFKGIIYIRRSLAYYKMQEQYYAIIPIILYICVDQLYSSLCLTFVGNINHFRGVYLLFLFHYHHVYYLLS